MPHWSIQSGDILDTPADVLVCSANVMLNLSGGVGGAILLRFGPQMQTWLHTFLRDNGRRTAEPGDVVASPPFGAPYRAVLHAVSVDAAYGTSSARIEVLVRQSLTIAAGLGATSVALTALGTGFGRMSMKEFGGAIAPLMRSEFLPVTKISLVVRHDHEAAEIKDAIAVR